MPRLANPPSTTRRSVRLDARADLTSDEALLRDLRTHIAANLESDLTLAALARRAEMSPSCFSRWFRSRTGITPHAFVIESRLERAKAMLRESDRSLLEIALSVGFTSQSCLNVAFRRRAGTSPNQSSKKAKDTTRRDVRSSPSRARTRTTRPEEVSNR
jgi:transcriptional regulator GlxA family with amidase domain